MELCADGGAEGDALVDTTTGGTGGHTRFPTGMLFHRTWPSLACLAVLEIALRQGGADATRTFSQFSQYHGGVIVIVVNIKEVLWTSCPL